MELSFFKDDEGPFVEVLTNDNATRTVGFKLGGHHPGPNIVIAGYFPVADAVYDRLVGLPTIGWMHGSLILIRLNELGDQTLDTYADLALDIRPDEFIFLPYHLDAHNHAQAVNDRYWWRSQLIDATHALKRSAGVSNPSVIRGRSLSCLATALSFA